MPLPYYCPAVAMLAGATQTGDVPTTGYRRPGMYLRKSPFFW